MQFIITIIIIIKTFNKLNFDNLIASHVCGSPLKIENKITLQKTINLHGCNL